MDKDKLAKLTGHDLVAALYHKERAVLDQRDQVLLAACDQIIVDFAKRLAKKRAAEIVPEVKI